MTPTKEQMNIIKSHVNKSGNFVCPSCQSETNQYMTTIENPSEDWTQVYCPYGCGYIELTKKIR